MTILHEQFDFAKQSVSATSKHITLQPGDKVLWRKTNRRMYGVSFDIRCTVVKVSAKSVKVLCRWRGKQSGQVIIEERNVQMRSLYRHDWAEVPVEVKTKSEAELMDECLEDIRSGALPIVRMTDEMLEAIENELF